MSLVAECIARSTFARTMHCLMLGPLYLADSSLVQVCFKTPTIAMSLLLHWIGNIASGPAFECTRLPVTSAVVS